MRALKQYVVPMLAGLVLAACGGGGGGGDGNAGGPPPLPTVTVTANQNDVNQASTTFVQVRVLLSNGQAVPEQTEVRLSLNDQQKGTVAPADGAGEPGSNASARTAGGIANFRFTSKLLTGPVVLTASVTDTQGTTRVATGSRTLNIVAGPSNRVLVNAAKSELPLNPLDLGFRFGGFPLYISETTVAFRKPDGNSSVTNGELQFSINPPSVATFSFPDDLSTDDVIELDLFLTNFAPYELVGGPATVYVRASTTPGDAVLTITARDLDAGGDTLTVTQTYRVLPVAPPLPATVSLSPANAAGALYVQGSGGVTALPLEAVILDGSANPVPNPNNNNVRFELQAEGVAIGASLLGLDAAGNTVEGNAISVRSTSGVAQATVRSGAQQGLAYVKAIADALDNNVDNGIQSEVSSIRPVIISDGKLFAIELTSPNLAAIRINPVADGIVVDLGSDTIPPLDGTYSLTVSALATDRQGNPVIPNTPIEFGVIDEPLSGYPELGPGFFDLSGTDGDPQEAGNLFTAPDGAFTTAGGGAGPGDTVIVFGEESDGNRDLESARIVEGVQSRTRLTVTQRFNRNDDTGVIVNNGPVLPYVIGKATDANITSTAFTDLLGVATTTLNYPVTQLGKGTVVWGRGASDVVEGNAEIATDAELTALPGVAPATLVASPGVIPANTTAAVTICVVDATNSPLAGIAIGFAFEGAQGEVDGQSGSGVVASPTGFDGCTVAQVTTSGILPGGPTGDRLVRFFGAGDDDDVEISEPGDLILQAFPSAFIGDGTFTINLRLLDASGNPIPGVQINGTCESEAPGVVGILTPPGVTDENGSTTAQVRAQGMNGFNEVGTGECTFTTATEEPEAIVTFTGIDQCQFDVSPPAPACGGDVDPPVEFTLTVVFEGAGQGNVTTSPLGLVCTGGTGQTCSSTFDEGDTVTIFATPDLAFCDGADADTTGDPLICAPTFVGDCVGIGPTPPAANGQQRATTLMAADRTCRVQFPTEDFP